jgi:pescadillo protein
MYRNALLLTINQIPADVDARVMLTFLELYQTLLGFVFFKLYADAGLVYPPPLDAKKDDDAAGINAFALEEQKSTVKDMPKAKAVEVGGKKISTKDVKQAIKSVTTADEPETPTPMETESGDTMADEDFVVQPSKADQDQAAALPTLHSISHLPQSNVQTLFSSCVFWLSRETSRPIFEFIVRSFGGRIGWPTSSGRGSPYDENEPSITHVIIDRPLVEHTNETPEARNLRLQRKYVQPQWVVDSINAGKLLLEEPYAQGATLPPHLSPFATYDSGYDPTAEVEDAEMSDSEEEDAIDVDETDPSTAAKIKEAITVAVQEDNDAALHAAELVAEAAGMDFDEFDKQAAKSAKKTKTAKGPTPVEDNPNKMLMSNKQRKLYERMKHSQKKSATEVS